MARVPDVVQHDQHRLVAQSVAELIYAPCQCIVPFEIVVQGFCHFANLFPEMVVAWIFANCDPHDTVWKRILHGLVVAYSQGQDGLAHPAHAANSRHRNEASFPFSNHLLAETIQGVWTCDKMKRKWGKRLITLSVLWQ